MKSNCILTHVVFRIALLAAGLPLFAVSTSHATLIYSEDFSSAPVWNNTVDNGNSNRAGTGVATDMNQNEWYTRGTRSTIAHDGVNENLDINNFNGNIYFLMDLTDLENDPGTLSEFQISFDVENFSVAGGTVNFFAFAGGGLDYSGNDVGDGHISFRTYLNPPLFNASQGATETQIVDGTTTSITSTGTFATNPFALNDLDTFGDYVVIGFEGTSNNNDTITIDNLQITTVVPEPSSLALIGLGGLTLVFFRRRTWTKHNLS